ncbi:NAD(P)-dependent oxidoreductase [Jiangella mangrovi]|uniref:3-hydroxyisobutyrate dehydrogenase n=1 Tax=Jiangella mangrovi TaxID=1524084 RepID=A0A7W9LLK8_9ACTN|nr:NAD(P)-dependent oxidoreductase [Jiangella mangrovi]MBB5788202.1 3-hydroxyisobutyrate dehydrogenase [Jiangella mangrovi]
MSRDPQRVAVIGLGAMGLPMATRLAEAFAVTAYEPVDERAKQAAGQGVTTAGTPAEAALGADVVVLAVRDQAQLEAAVFGPGGVDETIVAGRVVVVTSTIGPDAAREVATRLDQRGVLVVDAPVSGGPVRAGSGDLLVVVGAAPEALAAARPVLDHLGSTVTVVGPNPGDGQVLKAINQLLAGVHIAAAAEAIALARGVGLDPRTALAALTAGAASSFMLGDRGPRMVEAYEGGTDEIKSRLDIFVKDMDIVTSMAARAHVPIPLGVAAQQLYLVAERAGLGASDDSTVVTVLSPAGE